MLKIEHVSKSFGSKIIFDNASIAINSKERIGFVGRNGQGKTTLLHIITGQEAFDDGKIVIPKNYRIGYVRQVNKFLKSSVLEEGTSSLLDSERDHYWKAEKILSGIGFNKIDLKKNPNEFSSGKKIKLNLAKVLISDPNLLLLDEPTNYLDIISIRWIKKFLLNWNNELILITHNSAFMDDIVTHTAGIYNNKIKKLKGNTVKFYKHLMKEEQILERTRINQERTEKKVLSFIERFRAKAKLAGMVQSRIKSLATIKEQKKPEKFKILGFSFKCKPFRTRNSILTAKNLSFSYPKSDLLFNKLDFSIKANDRMCIIGKNGKGKSTLLKILAKILQPTTGSIKYNPQTKTGVFIQDNLSYLSESQTIEEEILCSHIDVNKYEARKICGTMMFEGDDAIKKINVLSGGEKSRVMLGKILVTPVNLLILDEPTNHLDMDSCDALLAAIDNFDGAVVMVTHNETFLRTIAKRLIVFDKYNTHIFEGGYQKFIDSHGWEDNFNKKILKNHKSTKLGKKELRRIRSNININKSKIINPVKKDINKIKVSIKKDQIKLDILHEKLIIASQKADKTKIVTFSCKVHNCNKIIKKQITELDKMKNLLEELQNKFLSKTK